MNVEQEVREMLSSKVRNAPGMDEPPQPVMRRARVRRVRNGIGVSAVAALIVLGSVAVVRVLGNGSDITPTGRTGVIPWTSETAPPLVGEPEPRACRAEDLKFTATSDFRALLSLEAVSEPCFLKNYAVQVLRSNGRSLPIGIVTVSVGARVAPGTETTLYGEWEPCAPPEALYFDLSLVDNGGTVRARSAPATQSTCSGGRTPTKLTFNGSAGAPTQRALAYLQILDNLDAKISGVRATARPGDTLRFRVTLRNVSREQIRLEPCPTYEELLIMGNGGPGGKRFVLNCEGAGGVIQPQESRSFEMKYTIPYDVEPGEWTLVWTLEEPPGIGGRFESATHLIMITAL